MDPVVTQTQPSSEGTPPVQAGASVSTPPISQQDWTHVFPEDVRNHADFAQTRQSIEQKYGNDPSKIYSGLLNAYRIVGKQQEGTIKVPGPEASEEEKQAFDAQMRALRGAPEKPEDYKHDIKLKDKDGNEIPFQFDQQTDSFIRKALHKFGMGNDAYAALAEMFFAEQQEIAKGENKKLMDLWGSDYLGKQQQVKAAVQRIHDAQLKAELADLQEVPIIQRIINYYEAGRREDQMPVSTVAAGMSIDGIRSRQQEVRTEMTGLDKYSPKYRQLDKELDDLIKAEATLKR